MRKNVWLGFLVIVALVAWAAVGVEAARYESLIVGEILLESAIKSADGTTTIITGGASGGAIDGENITDDSIDDDALDFADITGADLTLTDCGAIRTLGGVTFSAVSAGGVTNTLVTTNALIDGENVVADSIDDDSLDFADITGADLTLTDCGAIVGTSIGTGTGEATIDGKYAITGGDASTGLMVQKAAITSTATALQTNSFAVVFGATPAITYGYTEDPGDVRPIFTVSKTPSNFVASVASDKNFEYNATGTRP